MNRGDLIFAVSRKTGLEDASGAEERTLMETWTSDGVVEVLLRTHCYVASANVSLQASVFAYRADQNILALLDLQLASSGYGDYERVSLDELRDLRRRASTRYAFAAQGDYFEINPPPTTSDTLDILFVPRPTRMTADANDPASATYGGIPTQYHRAIEYYMLWQAAEYDEKRLPEAPKDYAQQFDDECKRIRLRTRNMGSRRLSPTRVGYPGSAVSSRRNDQYPVTR